MAGAWVPFNKVANPPAVHNFHDMLLVDRDLTSFFCYPDDWLWRKGPRRGYPQVSLRVDGREYLCSEFRWFAYRALRRNTDCGGLVIESDTRMINQERAVLVRVRVRNPGPVSRLVTLALEAAGELRDDEVNSVNTTQRQGYVSVIRPVQRPETLTTNEARIAWQWKASLAPGAEKILEFVAGDGAAGDGPRTVQNVQHWTREFAGQFEKCKTALEQRWADAFKPGNTHFSGNLPVLTTDNAALARNYYMGALTMLILERTQFPVHPRSFISNGERAPGTQYYWDASMQATAWALLEPAGMRATLRRWLVQNVRSGVFTMLTQTNGFDAKPRNRITGYAFNACTIFKTAYDYLRVTGDLGFLDERLETGKTVFERLDEIAADWKTLVPPGGKLASYGENQNLLECAPAYIHAVPSLNAQNVLVMRAMGELHALKGQNSRAAALRQEAADLLPAVLDLYKPGDGVWFGLHNNGQRVELRHCVDYIYVGNALVLDLSPAMRREMTDFVKRELFTRDWMRAMSQKDNAAERSDRPDHGPMGSYDGWIPLTVGVMWRLGAPRDAFEFYCRTAEVTKEGPFAQAHEFYGPDRTAYGAPVRVAQRQGCMKECIGGVAFTDVVINTFFGFMPTLDGPAVLVDPHTPRPFTARLTHVRNRAGFATIAADQNGLRIETE
jgi:hypothetical protein